MLESPMEFLAFVKQILISDLKSVLWSINIIKMCNFYVSAFFYSNACIHTHTYTHAQTYNYIIHEVNGRLDIAAEKINELKKIVL